MSNVSDLIDDQSEFVEYPKELRLAVFDVLAWANTIGRCADLNRFVRVDGAVVHQVRKTVVDVAVNHLDGIKSLMKIDSQDKQHEQKTK